MPPVLLMLYSYNYYYSVIFITTMQYTVLQVYATVNTNVVLLPKIPKTTQKPSDKALNDEFLCGQGKKKKKKK